MLFCLTKKPGNEGEIEMESPPKGPNPHIMALTTYCGLLPLVYFIPPMVGRYVHYRLSAVAISLAIIVPFISYILLPAVRWMLGRKTKGF